MIKRFIMERESKGCGIIASFNENRLIASLLTMLPQVIKNAMDIIAIYCFLSAILVPSKKLRLIKEYKSSNMNEIIPIEINPIYLTPASPKNENPVDRIKKRTGPGSAYEKALNIEYLLLHIEHNDTGSEAGDTEEITRK